MRKLILILNSVVFLSNQAWAVEAVQRTVGSSYPAYQKFLSESQSQSFVQAYIQISGVTAVDSSSVETCLEEMYLGQLKRPTCFQAVKALTSKPLNSSRREILFSFLAKLEKLKGPQQNFYLQLKKGLLWTHPELAKMFHVALDPEAEAPSSIEELELKAWKRSAERMFPLEEIALLINGKKVTHLAQWTAPQGIYQWTLVSNTHAPFTRLGSFTQFAAESLKDLKPLAEGTCETLADSNVKTYGIVQLSLFVNPKCIVDFGSTTAVAARAEHLGTLPPPLPHSSEFQKKSWILPGLALVGVGLALSLKGKQVSFQ